MLFSAISFVMTMTTAVSSIGTTMPSHQLRRYLSLLVEVHVDEVRHVVCAHVGELLKLDPTSLRWQNFGKLVDFPDAIFDSHCLLGCDEVQFVEDDFIREGNLL